MKASEVRVSNIAVLNGELKIITAHDISRMADQEELGITSSYCPVRITEEWLLKCGFSSPSKGLFRIRIHKDQNRFLETMLSFKDFWDFDIVIEHSYKKNSFKKIDTEVWIRALKYVHELQNFYWCITGTELEMK